MSKQDQVHLLHIDDEDGVNVHLSLHRREETAHREAAIFIKDRCDESSESLDHVIECAVKLQYPEAVLASYKKKQSRWQVVRQLLAQEKIDEAIDAVNDMDDYRITLDIYDIEP